MEATTYQVLEPLRHDGVDYAPKDVVALAVAVATPLVSAGVLAVLPAAERPTSGKGAAGRRPAPEPG